MIRRGLGERTRKDIPRYVYRLIVIATSVMLVRYYVASIQPPQVEEPPNEEDAGDEKGDVIPPSTSPMRTRDSASYPYISPRSRRDGSPTLTTTALDTGDIPAWVTTTAGRRLTKVARSGMSPARYYRSRAGSVVREMRGCVICEDGLGDEDEDKGEYIYQERSPPLARGREVAHRDPVPTEQMVVYQQSYPQYVYVHEGEEEYEDCAYHTPEQDPCLFQHPHYPTKMYH